MESFIIKTEPLIYTDILCVMEDLMNGSDFFRREFPPTDFVCNSMGELIHFDGPYDPDKHRAAYERAKKWRWRDGWESKPGMLPFRRLVADQLDPSEYRAFECSPEFTVRLRATKKEGWKNGLPPVCVGMLGTYKRKPAVVVDRVVREEEEEVFVGIGDPECLFKDYESENRISHYGPKTVKVRHGFWKLMTAKGDVELPVTSSMFHRTNRVVEDFGNRGVIRALKYIVDPITVAIEYCNIPDRLETKRPLEPIPRKKSKESFKRARYK